MRTVAETIAAIGERVVAAAMAQPELLRRVRLTEAETRLARIDPGYGRASTTSRLDAFLLPDSLTFAEYNAESPAGLAYAENLGRGLRRARPHGAVPRALRGVVLPRCRRTCSTRCSPATPSGAAGPARRPS